jgi:hypothetical protein
MKRYFITGMMAGMLVAALFLLIASCSIQSQRPYDATPVTSEYGTQYGQLTIDGIDCVSVWFGHSTTDRARWGGISCDWDSARGKQ